MTTSMTVGDGLAVDDGDGGDVSLSPSLSLFSLEKTASCHGTRHDILLRVFTRAHGAASFLLSLASDSVDTHVRERRAGERMTRERASGSDDGNGDEDLAAPLSRK